MALNPQAEKNLHIVKKITLLSCFITLRHDKEPQCDSNLKTLRMVELARPSQWFYTMNCAPKE
ncbi:MAG TPA: hypothetical protein ENK03_00725 [Candidatus Cloacimonetes bacterium]|nr:hypothetical protein [Candidatus Cloacimonadota bacterium]